MALKYLLGDPIEQFDGDFPPTLRDVLRFYSKFWGKPGSDSYKEKIVAQALMQVYQQANIPILNELTIKKKIKRSIDELKAILKFKSKTSAKTIGNIEMEKKFESNLSNIFDIRQGFRNVPGGDINRSDDIPHEAPFG